MDTRAALRRIIRFERSCIDTGLIADRAFIGIAGIGLDAQIGKRFKRKKWRGKLSYAIVILKEWIGFRPFQFKEEGQDQNKVFVLAFANTSQYGNNATIAPFAEFQDGKLEIVCISDLNTFSIPGLTWRFFSKSIHGS